VTKLLRMRENPFSSIPGTIGFPFAVIRDCRDRARRRFRRFIRSFVTEADRVFFRVFTGRAEGAFLTATRLRSAAFAREALALPKGNTATFIQEVRVPAGVRLQRSRATPLYGRRGGAEQFEILPGQRDAGIVFGPGVPFE